MSNMQNNGARTLRMPQAPCYRNSLVVAAGCFSSAAFSKQSSQSTPYDHSESSISALRLCAITSTPRWAQIMPSAMSWMGWFGPVAVGLLASLPCAWTNTTTVVVNHAKMNFTYAPTRLQVDVQGTHPNDVSVVDGNGNPVLSQTLDAEPTSGGLCARCAVWIPVTLGPVSNASFTVSTSGNRALSELVPLVQLTESKDSFTMSNGVVEVVVPASTASGVLSGGAALPPPPLASISTLGNGALASGTPVGGSSWSINANSSQFTSLITTVEASGPVFAQVTLVYTFVAPSGAPARFVTAPPRNVTIAFRLDPQVGFVRMAQEFTLGDNSSLTLSLGGSGMASERNLVAAAASGEHGVPTAFSPSSLLLNLWAYSESPLGLPTNPPTMQVTGKLEGNARYGQTGMVGYAYPRWTQGADARWGMAASDGSTAAGVLAVRAGYWNWPYAHNLELSQMAELLPVGVADPQSHSLLVRCPLRGSGLLGDAAWSSPGRRYLLVMAAPVAAWEPGALQTMLEAQEFKRLDKLTNIYQLEYPGQPMGGFSAPFFFDGGSSNPTGPLRHLGEDTISSIAQGKLPAADRGTLGLMQAYLDPDWLGGYWGHRSPENNNFNTDAVRYPIALSMGLTGHPQFKARLLPLVQAVFESDLEHSLFLSGASSEAQGYMGHAQVAWFSYVDLFRKYWDGYDATKAADGRLLKGAEFEYELGQPFAWHFVGAAAARPDTWGGRWMLPTGDTHPQQSNYSVVSGVTGSAGPADISKLTSVDLEGFGQVLRDLPGSMQETFAAIKAYPKRGHFHGDQLALHVCSHGMRLAIDIQAGYSPRPPEESWHSRLFVGAPGTNMDGYERSLGFVTGTAADVAVAEVASARLRYLAPNPNDNIWQAIWPTTRFAPAYDASGKQPYGPLVYRRTLLLVRGPASSEEHRLTHVPDMLSGMTLAEAAAAAAAAGPRSYIVVRDELQMPEGAVPNMTVSNTWLQMTQQMFKPTAPGTVDLGNGTQYTAVFLGGAGSNMSGPGEVLWSTARWDWPSEGNEQATAVYATTALPANTTFAQAVSVIYPAGSIVHGPEIPTFAATMQPLTGTVMLNISVSTSTDVLSFFASGQLGPDSTAHPPESAPQPLITLERLAVGAGQQASAVPTQLLSSADISYTKPQGSIAMTVLGSGYDFGQIPEDIASSRASQDSTYPWPPNSYFGDHALVV